MLVCGNIFEGIYLLVFSLCFGAVNDNKRIARFHVLSFFYEERIYSTGQLAGDSYFGCFNLSLQDNRLLFQQQHADGRYDYYGDQHHNKGDRQVFFSLVHNYYLCLLLILSI